MAANATEKISKFEKPALIAASVGMLAYSLDTAATQVGLPAIQASLELSAVASQWVFNLPIMIIAALVGVGGWLGDRKGRVRYFSLSLIIFALSAIVAIISGLMNNATLLMAGRALSGLGVAVFLPATSALIVEIYPLDQRGKALGTMFSITMLVTALGPTLAGFIVERVGWPWIYVPALLAALLSLLFLFRIKLPVPQQAAKFDFSGALLLALGVSLTIFGLMQAGAWGWTDSRVLFALAAGIVLLLAFVFVERKKTGPFIPVRNFQKQVCPGIGLDPSLQLPVDGARRHLRGALCPGGAGIVRHRRRNDRDYHHWCCLPSGRSCRKTVRSARRQAHAFRRHGLSTDRIGDTWSGIWPGVIDLDPRFTSVHWSRYCICQYV